MLRTLDHHELHRRQQARSILANPEGQKPSKIIWAHRIFSDDPPPPNRRYVTPGSRRAEVIRKYRPELYEELTANDPLPKVAEDAPRFVYVIEAVGSDRFKIGVAIDPGRRIKRLLLGSPFPLELRFNRWTLAPFWVETAVHKSLADHRVHSEWFIAALSDIIDAINGIIESAEASIRAATP